MHDFFTHTAKELKRHSFDYLILFSSGVMFLMFLKLLQGYRFYTFVVLLMFAIFYILWGVYHHAKIRNLHLKNIVEYVLIGFTVIFLLQIILSY